MDERDNIIMPPSVALTFLYSETPICSVPVFLLVLLAREQGESTEPNEFLNALNIAPDDIAENRAPESQASCIDYLQRTIPWQSLVPHVSCPSYLRDTLSKMWSTHISQHESFALRFLSMDMPDTVYRYLRFHADRIRELLAA